MTENDLKFDINNYKKEKYKFDGKEVLARAYYDIVYCSNPVDEIQKMNIFVPEAYYNGESINGYTAKTAPIFMPNTVGGYMPGPADKPGFDHFGNVNSIFYALEHGYVVASAGVRGRTTGKVSHEFFEGGLASFKEKANGRMVGRAPAFVVDMKAAVRYLKYNKNEIIGDTTKIITNGTSAGGALSALMGASGNNPAYSNYLNEIGALEGSDTIFAASCYCPIHNFENADMAYEWLFNKEDEFHMLKRVKTEKGLEKVPWDGKLSAEQMKMSDELALGFSKYVNTLGLVDSDGTQLRLEADGEGTFKGTVKSFVLQSAQNELENHKYASKGAWTIVEGSQVENQDFLTIENGIVKNIDFDGYVKTITRMKPIPAFDALDLSSPENEEFGDENVEARHFTLFSHENSLAKGSLASEETIRIMNPTKMLKDDNSTVAPYWRIRHGAYDRDTSIAIPIILQLMLKNKGVSVDFCLPWGVPHRGDYDLDELFAWIDEICK